MTFDAETTGLLLVVALVAAGVLLVLAVLQTIQLRRLRNDYRMALDPARNEDAFAALRRHDDALETIRRDIGTIDDNAAHLRDLLRGVTSRTAVVRYDAFDDMGGAMSFSAALLDERGSGLVITSINGRAETRTYAKPIHDGASAHTLSDEESRAIEAALAGSTEDLILTGSSVRRRRRRAS